MWSSHCIFLTKILKVNEVFFPSFDITDFKMEKDPCPPSEVYQEGDIQYMYDI